MVDKLNTSLNVSNATSTVSAPAWQFGPIYSTIMCILTVLSNGTVMLVFLQNHNLRSNAFCCYLMNLMLANLFHAVVFKPLEIVFLLRPGTDHSPTFCAVYIYAIYLADAMMMQCHVLITSNRVWAVTFPLAYQQRHSLKTAAVLCVSVWIFVCAVLLPGLIVDAIYTRATGDNINCLLHVKGHVFLETWNIVAEILLYISPLFIVMLAFPLIWWKRKHRRRARINTSYKPSNPVNLQPNKNSISRPEGNQNSVKTSTSFMVLKLLTFAFIILWSPLVASYSISLFGGVTIPVLYEAGNIMATLQGVLDPVLFSIALKDLRTGIRKLFGI